MSRSCKILLAPLFVLLLCFFLFIARHRFVDADEGFYLLASRLVLEHKVPYRDFYYNQTPLVPYIYGLWMKLFGISWFSARSLSALLTTILGLLVYAHVCRETARWVSGLAAVILYISSMFIFGWFPIVKTSSLAALFLFGAYVLVARVAPASPPWLVAIAGLLFGLSVDTRALVVGLAPIFLWWIFRHSEAGSGIARILWFLGGFTVGIVPTLCFFLAFPDSFLFNNLGTHAIRSNAGLIGNWKQKIGIARTLLFGYEFNGTQFSILWAVSFITILVLRIRQGIALLAFLFAFVLALISILPTPTFGQYFCMCVPYLIVAAVCGANNYITGLPAARTKRIGMLACAAMVVIFVTSSIRNFQRVLFTGDYMSSLYGADDAQNWTLDAVTAVSKAIDQVAAPHEEIASFWPGFIFASKADPYPGFENNAVTRILSGRLTARQKAKYHIIGDSEIAADFAAHTPRIAVFANRDLCYVASRASACVKILTSNGYTAVRTVGYTSVFVCCSRTNQ